MKNIEVKTQMRWLSRLLPSGNGLEMETDDLDGLNEVSREISRGRVAEQSLCIRNEVDQYLSDRYVSIFSKSFEIAK